MIDSRGQVVGYARVSTADQNLARQLEAIGPVDRMFTDKSSGKDVVGRDQLAEMLKYVREGDIIRAKSPDRLARDTIDLLTLVRDLGARGVRVQFVDMPELSTDSPNGEFVLTLMGAVAKLERSMIRQRQAEGIALAKAAGKYDRGPKLSAQEIAGARERVAAGVPKAVVARSLEVSRTTLYAALAGTGRYGRVVENDQTTPGGSDAAAGARQNGQEEGWRTSSTTSSRGWRRWTLPWVPSSRTRWAN